MTQALKKSMITFFAAVAFFVFIALPAKAQCDAVQLIHGADKYNKQVCDAYKASASGQDQKALTLFLAASREPLFELPNSHLFAPIAREYARLGDFNKAKTYLEYDNLALLWEIGIVSCSEDQKNLLKGGLNLNTTEANYMTRVVCGAALDDYTYFGNRNAEDFVATANAILRHAALRKEIEKLKASIKK